LIEDLTLMPSGGAF